MAKKSSIKKTDTVVSQVQSSERKCSPEDEEKKPKRIISPARKRFLRKKRAEVAKIRLEKIKNAR